MRTRALCYAALTCDALVSARYVAVPLRRGQSSPQHIRALALYYAGYAVVACILSATALRGRANKYLAVGTSPRPGSIATLCFVSCGAAIAEYYSGWAWLAIVAGVARPVSAVLLWVFTDCFGPRIAGEGGTIAYTTVFVILSSNDTAWVAATAASAVVAVMLSLMAACRVLPHSNGFVRIGNALPIAGADDRFSAVERVAAVCAVVSSVSYAVHVTTDNAPHAAIAYACGAAVIPACVRFTKASILPKGQDALTTWSVATILAASLSVASAALGVEYIAAVGSLCALMLPFAAPLIYAPPVVDNLSGWTTAVLGTVVGEMAGVALLWTARVTAGASPYLASSCIALTMLRKRSK